MRLAWVAALGPLAGAIALTTASAAERPGVAVVTVPLSARQLGMGGVGLSAGDVLRTAGNPAWLAGQEERGSLSASGLSLFGGGEVNGSLGGGLRVAVPPWLGGFDRLAFGGLVSYYGLETGEVDALGNPGTAALAQHVWLAEGAAAAGWRWARWGAGLKTISETYLGARATTVAADAGAVVLVGDAAAGIAARQLGPRIGGVALPVRGSSALPADLRLDLSYAWAGAGLAAGLGYVWSRGAPAVAAAGAEWWPARGLAVRAGVSGLGAARQTQVTFGLTAALPGLAGFDFATGAHALGWSNLVTLSVVSREPAPGRAAHTKKAAATVDTGMLLGPKLISMALGAREWRIDIKDRGGQVVRTLKGSGAPPKTLAWDGMDDRGRPVLDMSRARVELKLIGADGRATRASAAVATASATRPEPQIKVLVLGVVDPETVFEMPQADYRSWKLTISDLGRVLASWQDSGLPPGEVRWSGRDQRGVPFRLYAPTYAWEFAYGRGRVMRGERPLPLIEADVNETATTRTIRVSGLDFTGRDTRLSERHRDVLERAAFEIRKTPNATIRLESVAVGPTREEAEDLAKRRAESIHLVLVSDYACGGRSLDLSVRRAEAGERQTVDLFIVSPR